MSETSFVVATVLLLVLLVLFLCWLFRQSSSWQGAAALRRNRIVQAALSYDLAQARRRYVVSSVVSEDDAAFHEREFRRFFAIMALHPGVAFGLRHGPVDDYWHALIGCTALYRSFCTAVAGRFVDHDPDGGGEGTYGRTWNAYRALFGEDPPASVWPTPSEDEMRAASSKVTGSDASSPSSSFDDGGYPMLGFFDSAGSQLAPAGHHAGDGPHGGDHGGDGGGHGGDGGGDGGGGDGGGCGGGGGGE